MREFRGHERKGRLGGRRIALSTSLETGLEIGLATWNAWEKMVPFHAAPSWQFRAWRVGVGAGKERDLGRLSAPPQRARIASASSWLARSRSRRPGDLHPLMGEHDITTRAGNDSAQKVLTQNAIASSTQRLAADRLNNLGVLAEMRGDRQGAKAFYSRALDALSESSRQRMVMEANLARVKGLH